MKDEEIFLDENVWKGLVQRLERLPHALLLHGPRGIGKLRLAERFAQLLLCEAGDRRNSPCRVCAGCRWFVAGNHPDARLIEPETIAYEDLKYGYLTEFGFLKVCREVVRTRLAEAGKAKPSAEIRIDQVRELGDFLNIGSHRGARRVAIVHPAEDMNAHAANSLLKSLEEPPSNAVFLLVAHRPARLLPTIRSRCVQVPVPLPDAAAARAWLEGQGVRDAARWLAFAGGAPRLALECASGERGARTEAVLRALAGGEGAALEGANDREQLELLAEALQKHALDCALAAFGAPRRYTEGSAPPASQRRAWLAYARAMGRNRALARHPLNARLFSAEMLAAMPPM